MVSECHGTEPDRGQWVSECHGTEPNRGQCVNVEGGLRHRAFARKHQLLRSVRSDTQAVSKRGGCERISGAGL